MFSSGFQNVVVMALVLGVVSYGIGLAPLSIPLSKKQLFMLSNLGTGLLIGTALGVILPEGIEQLVANGDREQSSYSFAVGIPVLLGFALMFLLEEYTSSYGHCQPVTHSSAPQPHGGPCFEIDLEEVGRLTNRESPHAGTSVTRRAYPLSFGLTIHALIDGYALGVSASNAHSPSLSFLVFLAIAVHKAPTALSLTTALLANSFSVAECKKHLLYFSLATPVSSLVSYGLYTFHGENQSAWSSSALLFSGGTFLYVASVLQPISSQTSGSAADEIGKTVRAVLLVGGMFSPVVVSRFVGHEHH